MLTRAAASHDGYHAIDSKELGGVHIWYILCLPVSLRAQSVIECLDGNWVLLEEEGLTSVRSRRESTNTYSLVYDLHEQTPGVFPHFFRDCRVSRSSGAPPRKKVKATMPEP